MLFWHIFCSVFLSRVFEQGFIYAAFDISNLSQFLKFYEDFKIKMEHFLQLERSHTHRVYMFEHRS